MYKCPTPIRDSADPRVMETMKSVSAFGKVHDSVCTLLSLYKLSSPFNAPLEVEIRRSAGLEIPCYSFMLVCTVTVPQHEQAPIVKVDTGGGALCV